MRHDVIIAAPPRSGCSQEYPQGTMSICVHSFYFRRCGECACTFAICCMLLFCACGLFYGKRLSGSSCTVCYGAERMRASQADDSNGADGGPMGSRGMNAEEADGDRKGSRGMNVEEADGDRVGSREVNAEEADGDRKGSREVNAGEADSGRMGSRGMNAEEADSGRMGSRGMNAKEADSSGANAEGADSSVANAEGAGSEEAGILDGELYHMDIQNETDEFLADLGLSDLDDYLQQADLGQLTFSELVKDLISDGLLLDFSSIGKKLKAAVLQDYTDNRTVLIQILAIAVAFSILLQMTSTIQKNYISSLGFLGVYLILMLLLCKLFLLMTGIVEGYFTKLVEFMMMLQPVFCMSMVFSTGSISAGAYYQLLLIIIYIIDLIFAKILLPAVQIYMVLQLVNNLMEEERFTRIAGLISDGVGWCVKILTTAVVGMNIVQGLLAPGIDGLKRSTIAGAMRVVPGIGQVMNSMSEILAGSAVLIKNSVGAAALLILVMISFLPIVKLSVFLLLYRGLAAFMEPVADKRFCSAVAALGQSAALYLKLMFYAVLLFFLTIAIICCATTLSLSMT